MSVHAEMNAIIQASKEELEGSTLYLYGVECNNLDNIWTYVSNPMPCVNCRRAIINAKIQKVIIQKDNNTGIQFDVDNWEREENIVGGY